MLGRHPLDHLRPSTPACLYPRLLFLTRASGDICLSLIHSSGLAPGHSQLGHRPPHPSSRSRCVPRTSSSMTPRCNSSARRGCRFRPTSSTLRMACAVPRSISPYMTRSLARISWPPIHGAAAHPVAQPGLPAPLLYARRPLSAPVFTASATPQVAPAIPFVGRAAIARPMLPSSDRSPRSRSTMSTRRFSGGQ